MKKVLGTALVAAILVAALPSTASASGALSKGCVGGSWLRPCRAPMPPSSSGTGRGSSNGTNRSGSQGNTGTNQGSGTKGTLPPAPLGGR
jgi:hypothetical protein